MKISTCVPLPGPGVVARRGTLVAVTDGHGAGPDPLLDVLAEVTAASGDGRELIRLAARAALGAPGQPSWACAGVTADGAVVVLVYGQAKATVHTAVRPPVTLTASDSVIPVSRTFTGPVITLELAIGDPAAPDSRCWLDGGVVPGGGLVLTVAADSAGPAPAAGGPAAAAGEAVAAGDGARPAGPPSAGPRGGPPPTVLGPPPARPAPVPWEPAPPEPAPLAPAPDSGSGRPPPPAGPDRESGSGRPETILADGAVCDRGHVNDPGALTCRHCGSRIGPPPGNPQRGQQPHFGLLVLDDGTRITLDGDYVVGREPALDGDVIAGRARPLRMSDPEGTVSRLHLKISLAGGQVEVCDLGSANGSVIQSSGGERALAPFESAVVEPGAWISIGHRSMQYLAHQGVLP